MTTSPTSYTEETRQIAGAELKLLKAGSGDPLVVLHGELGHPGWLRCYEELAKEYTVYIPLHPGFGVTSRLEWIMTMRDFSCWYLRAFEELGLVAPNVLGFSMGGWLAAEMAAQQPRSIGRLALVSPPGIKPLEGEIMDMFLITSKEYFTASILNPSDTPGFDEMCPEELTPEHVDMWEDAREEACRLSWRPYMLDPALPHLLSLVKDLPTLLIWGEQDTVVPLSAGKVYQHSLSGSELVTIPNCGHRPELENPDEFVRLTKEFFG